MQAPQSDDGRVNWLAPPAPDDERRNCFRIDDRLLLEYWLEGESGPSAPQDDPRSLDEAIRAFMGSTAESFSKDVHEIAHEAGAGSLVMPQLMKIDWALEIILKALARISPEAITLPRLTYVNISGNGICFDSPRSFRRGDGLEMRLILPPFIPVQLKAEVVRVQAWGEDLPGYLVAGRFTAISHDDRERLIRHILHLQAKRLRGRRMGCGI
jgi:hypothetical protein